MKYDTFVSYAGEDEKFVTELVGGLKARGFKIWYAPLNLKVGDELLDSIEKGMTQSEVGIILISNSYLKKGWTNYEMDTLVRQHIELKKKILPIWHGITKEEIVQRHAGLAGIFALDSSIGIHNIIIKLVEVLKPSASTLGVIPSYESPKFHFLRGRGEINLNSEEGPATTLWEFLINAQENEYPLYLEGEVYTKNNLLFQAAQLLPHIPNEVEKWVGKEGKQKIWNMCKEVGYNPDVFQ